MFGCFGIYVNNKMYFFLRDRKDKKELNGVWICVATPDRYDSLARELPSINQELAIDEKSKNRWLLLSNMDDEFESLVIRACELVLKNDKRIGKITRGSL